MRFPDRLMIKALPGEESVLYIRADLIEREKIETSEMYCQVGNFHWDVIRDGECPNHGIHRTGPHSGKEGPEDGEGIPYLGCCSIPSEQ